MTDLRQAAQQAMENLENLENLMEKSIAALRTALEQQAEPPPEWPLIKNILAVFGLDAIAFVAEWKAAQQQAEPVAWQPIETAPKDGNAILVMRDIWPGTKSGRAEECNGHNTYVAAWWGDENNGRGAWVCYMDSVCEPQCPIEPTHWMPLPCPPSIAPPQQQAEPVTREGFEKWAKFAAPYMDISRFEAGYSDCNTDYAWVGWQAAQRKELSASEILNMMPSAIPAEYDGPLMEFARAVEAKLKEKNGY